jgi:hypothetical protein
VASTVSAMRALSSQLYARRRPRSWFLVKVPESCVWSAEVLGDDLRVAARVAPSAKQELRAASAISPATSKGDWLVPVFQGGLSSVLRPRSRQHVQARGVG